MMILRMLTPPPTAATSKLHSGQRSPLPLLLLLAEWEMMAVQRQCGCVSPAENGVWQAPLTRDAMPPRLVYPALSSLSQLPLRRVQNWRLAKWDLERQRPERASRRPEPRSTLDDAFLLLSFHIWRLHVWVCRGFLFCGAALGPIACDFLAWCLNGDLCDA